MSIQSACTISNQFGAHAGKSLFRLFIQKVENLIPKNLSMRQRKFEVQNQNGNDVNLS